MECSLKQQFARNLLDQFPGISEAIQERLSATMLLRRKRILYRRSRYGKTAIKPAETVPQPVIKPAEASLKTLRAVEENLDHSMKPVVPGNLPLSVVQSNIRSATTLAPERFHKASTPSVVSAAKTVALSNHQDLVFPLAPQSHIKERYLRMKAQREAEYAATVAEIRSKSAAMSGRQLGELIYESDEQLRTGLENDMEGCRKAVMEITCPLCFYSLSSLVVNDENKWR